MSDTCEQISSSARFAISTPPPRSVTILLAIAQKSSLYYIRTYFDRRRRTMCWKSPLWAHKECRSHPPSARSIYPHRRAANARPLTDIKTSTEYSTQLPTGYSTRTPQARGCKLPSFFLQNAFILFWNQSKIAFPLLDIIPSYGTDITLPFLPSTAIDKEQNRRIYYSKLQLSGL